MMELILLVVRVIFVIGKSVGFLMLGETGEAAGFFENINIENGILYIHG
jgi:hypothetical protein